MLQAEAWQEPPPTLASSLYPLGPLLVELVTAGACADTQLGCKVS